MLPLTAVGPRAANKGAEGEPRNSDEIPPAVKSIVNAALQRVPTSLNTDWFGTMLMHGLLLWNRRGVSEVEPFARAWLQHHLQSSAVSKFSGPRSRVVTVGGIPITTYAGHYGLAFPCYEMARQFDHRAARRVCIDIADVILHLATRNRFGLVGHDDQATFAIPDTCYFVAPPLMLASLLDEREGAVFRKQALYQIRTYVDVFLARDTGLSKTILLETGLGKTNWTRASGWLLWAINGVLRQLPPTDREFTALRGDLSRLAQGITRVQDVTGGFRVLMDDPSAPLETTGTAMFAAGLHEGVRRGWLESSHLDTALRAWSFVELNITVAGEIRHAYTGWAVPAENRIMSMDEHKMEWIPGMILLAAHEMTTSTKL
jgi:hypothetical protein